MRNYKLTIQYDGSSFHGWQIQSNDRTVQGEIENAFSLVFPGEKICLIGAGRTDAGVHALGQVAHIFLPDKLSTEDIEKAINGNINNDVRIKNIEKIEQDFHARFSAISREYEYHIVKSFNPIKRNYSTALKYKVNIKLLDECTALLLNEHDFSSFCKANSEVDNKNCSVYSAIWNNSDDMLIFNIKANRFLHHMVRYLVGTMLEVARGRYSVKEFKSLLNNKESKSLVVRAPAQGLFLKKIYYN